MSRSGPEDFFFLGSGPGSKDFFFGLGPSLILTRSGLILARDLNTVKLKSMYNTLVLLFSTKRTLIIFEALIDRNKHQEMIVYQFFSPDNQL